MNAVMSDQQFIIRFTLNKQVDSHHLFYASTHAPVLIEGIVVAMRSSALTISHRAPGIFSLDYPMFTRRISFTLVRAYFTAFQKHTY